MQRTAFQPGCAGRAKQRSAFTLIELLVVISIIGILASLLLPVLGRARESGRRASCASNLHQIGAAMINYSDDYSGWFPTCDVKISADSGNFLNSEIGITGGGNGNVGNFTCWARYLVKKHYLADPGVFHCPSDHIVGNNTPVFSATSWQNLQWYNLSYLYIIKLNTKPPLKAVATSQMYMLMADRQNADGASKTPPETSADDNHGLAGRNVLFTDGHVEWHGPDVNDLWKDIQADWGEMDVDNLAWEPQTIGTNNHN